MEPEIVLLFWYQDERNWSIQKCTTIIKPRKEPKEYKAGDYVHAKFSGKSYPAVVIGVDESKDNLTQTARQLEEVLQDTSLDHKSVMEKMGIDVTTSSATAEVSTGTTEINRNTEKRSACKPKKKKDDPKKQVPASTTVKAAEKEKKRKQQAAILEATNLMTKKIVTEATYLSSNLVQLSHQKTGSANSVTQPVGNLNQLSPPAATNFGPVINQLPPPAATDSLCNSNQLCPPVASNFGPVNNQLSPPAATVSGPINSGPPPRDTTNFDCVTVSSKPSSPVNPNFGHITQLSPPPTSYFGPVSNQLSSSATTNHMFFPANKSPGYASREQSVHHNTQLLPVNSPKFITCAYSAPSLQTMYPDHYGSEEVFDDPYETKEQEQDQSTYPDFIGSFREASEAINGAVPGLSYQGEACNERCQQKMAELQSKINFLENHLMESFMDKLVNAVQKCPPALHLQTSTGTSGTILVESNQIENSDFVPLVDGLRPKINKKQLEAVKRKAGGSATSLARHLLVAFFTPDQLAHSSARGSKTRPALDKEVVDAVICFVMQSYPKEIERNIIQAINGKCCDTRLTLNLVKKSNKKAQAGLGAE